MNFRRTLPAGAHVFEGSQRRGPESMTVRMTATKRILVGLCLVLPVAFASVSTSEARSKDVRAPSIPSDLTVVGKTPTTVTVNWRASRVNVGVAAYGLYRNSVRIGTTTSNSYSFAALACGTTYRLSVDAVDARNNRSRLRGRDGAAGLGQYVRDRQQSTGDDDAAAGDHGSFVPSASARRARQSLRRER